MLLALRSLWEESQIPAAATVQGAAVPPRKVIEARREARFETAEAMAIVALMDEF